MIVSSLTVEGFRIIGNKIHIDFPEDGRIGIFGHNESGKSTIFDAIEFALFGLSLRGITKEDIITWGKNKLVVNLVFTSGDNQYQIQRSLTRKGSAHKVKLVQISNGSVVSGTEIMGIQPVEETIEDIIGMDKNSYSKLIYIRQKELDALKDLQKHDREKLINKVIGIDIFDDATDDGRFDLKEEERNFETIESNLQILSKNYDSYVKKSEEIKDLAPVIVQLESDLKNIQDQESQLKKKLQQLEWIKNYKTKKEIIESKKSELVSESSNLTRIKSEKYKIQKYNSMLEQIKPKLENLKKIHAEFLNNEEEIEHEEKKLEDEKSTLPQSSIDRPQLMKKRSADIKKGIGLLVGGLILIAIGLVIIFSIILGIILVIISALFFKKYRDVDKKLIHDIDNQFAIRSISSHKLQISELNKKNQELQNKYAKSSSEEVELDIEKLNSMIREETDSSNIEELQGVLSNLQRNYDSRIEEELEDNVNSLNLGIEENEKELRIMENHQPPDINLENSIEELQEVQSDYDDAIQRFTQKSTDLSAYQAQKKQLEVDCEELQKDFEEYPQKLKEKETIENKIKLLNFVISQFKQVSEKMRSLVIPQARHEINQILPIITDNRYSDFNITEDLKFQVYTQQTGGYKQRELFSGGTQDQFLIALRLAFTKSILDSRIKNDEYSLFMDETISSSDDARKTGIFDLLEKVRKTFRQIFIIAHEDISDMVDHHLILQSGPDGFTTIKRGVGTNV